MNTVPSSSAMEVVFVDNLGQMFTINVSPTMELENVMALLEAEVNLLDL
jgi:hypothetical protein